MAQKWNLQDIVPPERARDRKPAAPRPSRKEPSGAAPEERSEPISIRGGQEAPIAAAPASHDDDQVDAVVARLEVTDGRLSRIRRYIIFGVMLAVILFVGLSATILLSGAEVKIKPKIHETSVQADYEAHLQPGIGELGYELLTLEEEGERQVPATGQEEVNERASGPITIYNNFSSTPQRLIKNTRFESPTGLVYRISDSAVIPGYKKDASGAITPGSVTATVFADGTGETYNLAEARFTIPGLKGSEQYDKMYAEIGKDGIAGGFEGTKFIIDETELSTTRQKLQTELRDKLLSRIATERPNGFVAFDQAITFTFESLPAEEGGDNSAVIKERTRLHIPLFKESDFAGFIAKSTVPGYDNEPVRLEDPKKLVFSYTGGSLEDISTKEAINFRLSGSAKIIWEFNEAQLKKDLAGASEQALPTILSGYPSIDKAEAVIRPIWKSSFPENVEEIKVLETMSLE